MFGKFLKKEHDILIIKNKSLFNVAIFIVNRFHKTNLTSRDELLKEWAAFI